MIKLRENGIEGIIECKEGAISESFNGMRRENVIRKNLCLPYYSHEL